MKKLAFLVAVMLVLSLALVGCSGSSAAAAGQLRFMLVLPMGANEVWNACAEGFQAACAAIGAEAVIVSPSTPNDVNQMNALIETAIAESFDGIVTQGLNPGAQAPVFAQLDQAGMPFCLVNSDIPDSNRLAFIGTGDELGIVGGKTVVEVMAGKQIKFATALFELTAPIAISLHNAYLSELQKSPGFEEVVVIHTASDQLVSVREWTNAFMTYPEINAGMNICGFGGLGAARAMKELGIEPGAVCMIAIDDVPQTLDGIRDGYLYGTMTQNFFRMGYEPVIWLSDFLQDGKKPANVVNDSGTMLVTMDNIDTYAADMRDPSKW